LQVSANELVIAMSEAGAYRADDQTYEQLVAYLDGELDAESSLQLERRLAQDERFRQELHQLQRAWDLLDELPTPQVSESFTQTTVEMVAHSAEEELKDENTAAGRIIRLWWMAATATLMVTALCTYWLVTAALAYPNERLLRDLPVIENIDLYRKVDSLEYLQKLHESGHFDEEIEDAL
jgi:anti-sigma factor RsiW